MQQLQGQQKLLGLPKYLQIIYLETQKLTLISELILASLVGSRYHFQEHHFIDKVVDNKSNKTTSQSYNNICNPNFHLFHSTTFNALEREAGYETFASVD